MIQDDTISLTIIDRDDVGARPLSRVRISLIPRLSECTIKEPRDESENQNFDNQILCLRITTKLKGTIKKVPKPNSKE